MVVNRKALRGVHLARRRSSDKGDHQNPWVSCADTSLRIKCQSPWNLRAPGLKKAIKLAR